VDSVTRLSIHGISHIVKFLANLLQTHVAMGTRIFITKPNANAALTFHCHATFAIGALHVTITSTSSSIDEKMSPKTPKKITKRATCARTSQRAVCTAKHPLRGAKNSVTKNISEETRSSNSTART